MWGRMDEDGGQCIASQYEAPSHMRVCIRLCVLCMCMCAFDTHATPAQMPGGKRGSLQGPFPSGCRPAAPAADAAMGKDKAANLLVILM